MNYLLKPNILLLFIVSFLVACGPRPEDISATIENKVIIAVAATMESMPSSTPYHTLTPYSTQTPLPTLTPNPTYTPLPTLTPYPTLTSLPTATATSEPTPTATPIPSDTATPIPTLPAVTSTPQLNQAVLLQNEIAATIIDLTAYKSNVLTEATTNPVSLGWYYNPVNCAENIVIYDRVISVLVLDTSNSDPIIQNVYARYRANIDAFITLANGWTQGCQESIAAGDSMKKMGTHQRDEMTHVLSDIENDLNQAYRDLTPLTGQE